jgi:hypothetical protein
MDSNYIDPDILEFLSIGQEVYFNMRFNRQHSIAHKRVLFQRNPVSGSN